jgi:hypothetical protein
MQINYSKKERKEITESVVRASNWFATNEFISLDRRLPVVFARLINHLQLVKPVHFSKYA